MSAGPSLFLSWDELACHDQDRTPYPSIWRDTRGFRLAVAFDAVRHACGDLPITVLSGFRTAIYNRQIGGGRHSQHVEGRALDLRPPAGWTVDRFVALVLLLARTSVPTIRGVGTYRAGQFVHLDVRPGTHLAIWTGSRQTT